MKHIRPTDVVRLQPEAAAQARTADLTAATTDAPAPAVTAPCRALLATTIAGRARTGTDQIAAADVVTPDFGILVAEAKPTDFLASTYGGYVNWVAGISDDTFRRTVRLAFTLILVTAFCGLTFHHLRLEVSRGTLMALRRPVPVPALFLALEIAAASVALAPIVKSKPRYRD